jgi:NADH-quinone oxidoreductase subunit J
MPAGGLRADIFRRGNFMEKAFFLLFAAVAIGSGLMVIMARNPIHSALSLIVSLVQVAAIFVLLGSPFLAAIQIFVYVGAVMVLFLFVIMMLDVRKEARTRFLEKGIAPALVVLVLLGGEMIALLLGSQRFPVLSAGAAGSLEELSKTLFTDYLLPFEVASVILLVALVGAILLARKETD